MLYSHDTTIQIYKCREIPKYWRLSLVRVRNVYKLFLTFSFSTRGEKDTIFTMLTVPTSPTVNSPGELPGPGFKSQLSSPIVESQLASPRFKSQLTVFSKITKIPSTSLPGMTSFTPLSISYLGFQLWHLWLSHPLRTSVNTCTKCRTVQSLTKPNKI